jgi:hypothetical protein
VLVGFWCPPYVGSNLNALLLLLLLLVCRWYQSAAMSLACLWCFWCLAPSARIQSCINSKLYKLLLFTPLPAGGVRGKR